MRLFNFIISFFICSTINAQIEISHSTTDIFIRNPINISHSVEPDSRSNRLLADYIYFCIQNEQDSVLSLDRKELDSIFRRDSFKKCVYQLLNDSDSLNFFYPESQSLWYDNCITVLRYCHNDDILYEIADSLLAKNNDLGLIRIWEDVNPKLLHNIKNFENFLLKNENWLRLSELAVIYHNASDFCNRDRILMTLRDHDPALYLIIEQFMNNKDKISYYDWLCDVANVYSS